MEIDYVRSFYENKIKKNQDCYFEDKILPFMEGRLQVKTTHFMAKHLIKCKNCHEKSLQVKKFLIEFGQLVPSKKIPSLIQEKSENHIKKIVNQFYIKENVGRVIGPRAIEFLGRLKEIMLSPETLHYVIGLGFFSLLYFLVVK